MILRTFHLNPESQIPLDITEQTIPNSIAITIGTDTVILTKDQFEELCELRYKVAWAAPAEE